MAERLSRMFGLRLEGRRAVLWLSMVLAVLLTHGCVMQLLAQRMAEFGRMQAMPARIEVAYVRELALEEPPAAPPVVVPPKPRSRAKSAKPARAASAPAATPSAAESLPAPAEVASAPTSIAAESLPATLDSAAGATPDTLAPEPPAAPEQVAMPASAAQESPPATPLLEATQPPVAALTGGAAESASHPFDWPASTRMSYALTGNYRGEVLGSAQVEWIRSGSRYQVHLDLILGPSLTPLFTRRMSSDGEITAEGLSPRRYDEDSKAVFRERRRLTMLFEPDAVVMPTGQRRERWPGVQDTASQFVQLIYLFTTRPDLLQVGKQFDVPLALPRNIDRWTYDVVKEEIVYTPFGEVPSFHVKPRRVSRPGSDLVVEIWFAPQLRYLPVRIRVQQDAETFADLVLDRRPQIAAQ